MRAYDDGSLNVGYSFLLSFPFYSNTSAGRKLCLPKLTQQQSSSSSSALYVCSQGYRSHSELEMSFRELSILKCLEYMWEMLEERPKASTELIKNSSVEGGWL